MVDSHVLLDLLQEALCLEARRDSLEIGTPGSGGRVKVYGDFGEPEAFRIRLETAFNLRRLARKLAEEEAGP
ncbi:MAG: hypothetical protein V3U45_01160 [bacterium]